MGFTFAFSAAFLLLLEGCSLYERPRRPAWRTEAENACLARRLVRVSAYVQPANEIEGPSICGLTRPFKVSALQDGAVLINSTSTLDCPMIAALEAWLKDVVQPAARTRLGQEVATLKTMGSYSCRPMNNQPGARLSEHSFGNALDIGGFGLADGTQIPIQRDWTGGDEATKAFLRDVHAGACSFFTTVLGPGSNIFHYNHIHVDLAMHGATSTGPRRICKPTPQRTPLPEPPRDGLPDAPDIYDEIDIAQAGAPMPEPPPAPAERGLAPVANVPPQPLEPPRRPAISAYAPRPDVPIPPAPVGRFIAQNRAATVEGHPSDWDLPGPLPQR